MRANDLARPEQTKKILIESIDQLDEIQAKAAQLSALLMSMYGQGFETFECMSREDQENLIWLACDLSLSIRNIAEGRPA